MTDRRVSLFGSEALAARIERAESEFMVSCSESIGRRHRGTSFAIAIAGGFATYAGQDSPFNKVSGLGFGVMPSESELEAVEQAFATREAPVQFEISILGDSELGGLLTDRGYRLVSFENVLGHALDTQPADSPLPPGIEVRRGEDRARAWLDIVIEGAAHPDTEGLAQHEEFPREGIEQAEVAMADAGMRLYLAMRDGVVAGGAGLRITNGLAQMTGAATAPEHRRHGVHTALLGARLRDASAQGCDVAVVTTQPGSPSHRNTQKMGFDLLYTRAILVRPS